VSSVLDQDLNREVILVENALYHLLKACFSGELEDYMFALKQILELEQFKNERIVENILEQALIYAKKKGYAIDDILNVEDKVGITIPAKLIAKVYGVKSLLNNKG